MIRIEIPGSGLLELEHFVTDFSGTLSEDGILLPGVREKLEELSGKLKIHVLTSDTFGRARKELEGVNCVLHVLEGERHVVQKEKYVMNIGADKAVALGNGNNDVLMLKAARLGIAVCLKEGCSKEALEASQILVTSPIDAIDLLLSPKRLIATLRI
ncbi:MAG: HAD hydrolase family protein [Thermodesulfovibrionales bacterium]|nr:HAD hydrolase family protein [Thermodesulfovibrionales bacterium]